MTMIPVPQHVLIDRVSRALERQGARLYRRDPNKRALTDPGDILIARPIHVLSKPRRLSHGTMSQTYPGTLEELARELGVLDARERLIP